MPGPVKEISLFPKSEQDPRHAYQVVHDELMLDGNSRQNLTTFCQTWAEPEVHKLMDEYPQTAEIEGRCVHMLADLWNSPTAANTIGCSTTGSSEAAMLGGMAMKRAWEKNRKAEGKPIDKPNLIRAPFKSAGTSSHAIGTSNIAKSQWSTVGC